MNLTSVDSKLLNLLCQAIGEENRSKITSQTRMEDIDAWNSLTFIDIVLAVEKEYGLQISPELAAEMTSVEAIQKIIQNEK